MKCAWCFLSLPQVLRMAVTVYKGDALCEEHVLEKRKAVKAEWRRYLAKKRKDQVAPW